MITFRTIEELFKANTQDGFRVYVNQGGTSSGKTMTILDVLFFYAINEGGCVITIVGQDLPNLKVGSLRDARTIIGGSDWLSRWFTINESSSTIRGLNGSLIEFKSYDNAQDAKNGKRDYLFINEANGIPYEIYWQLQIRTRKKVYIDYNPSERFWVHDEVIGREGVKLIISDHRGNGFLTETEHQRIENIEDKELWRVYARGLTGKVQGLVLTNWDIVDELPPRSEWKVYAHGMDFGFSADPTALELVVQAHGELWVDELIYETGMTNLDIVARARSLGVTRADMIIADCAEPKSIAEIQASGLWCVPSIKGADSIVVGLDILRRYKIHVTRRSRGIISNLKSYKWQKDRDGKETNHPQDKNNHGIDAIRYVALAKFNTQRPRGGRTYVTRL